MWCVANDSPVWLKPRRTIWFIVRDMPRGTTTWADYIHTPTGRLRTWKTAEAARAFLARLNDTATED